MYAYLFVVIKFFVTFGQETVVLVSLVALLILTNLVCLGGDEPWLLVWACS